MVGKQCLIYERKGYLENNSSTSSIYAHITPLHITLFVQCQKSELQTHGKDGNNRIQKEDAMNYAVAIHNVRTYVICNLLSLSSPILFSSSQSLLYKENFES